MKPHYSPRQRHGHHHHQWHSAGTRWHGRALLVVGAVAGFVLVANLALLVPLLRHRDSLHQDSKGGSLRDRGFFESFDTNGDGVLDVFEYQRIVAEACSLDLARLPFWKRVRKLLNPWFVFRSPCAKAQIRTAIGSALDPRSSALNGGSRGGRGGGGSGGGGAPDLGSEASGLESAQVAKDTAARRAAALAGCPALTGDLLEALAVRNTVLLVAADWASWDVFGVNWIAHVQRAGVTNYLVAALDQKTKDFLVKNKLGHCTPWGALPAQAQPYKHGSDAHKAASWARLDAAAAVVEAGYDVIVSDLDTIWFKDPNAYIAEHVPSAADLVAASDQLSTTNGARDAGLEARPDPSQDVHTGVLFVRSSPGGRAALKALQQHRPAPPRGPRDGRAHDQQGYGEEEGEAPDDDDGGKADHKQQQHQQQKQQHPSDALQAWLRSGGADGGAPTALANSTARLLAVRAAAGGPAAAAGEGASAGWLGLGWGGGGGGGPGDLDEVAVAVGVFSPAVVQHGHSAFVSKLHEALELPPGAAPVAVHFSWSGRSKESRLHRMREGMWYADGPTYYTDPLLMSFDPGPVEVPANFSEWTNDEEMLQVHIAAMTSQLAEFYAAAALAMTLGRALVLPPFTCFCYRHDAPTELCRAPGDRTSRLPFTCTLEQIFKPKALYAHLPVVDRRPVMFREHSFLDNKRTPGWVKHARTEVYAGDPRCGAPGPPMCVEVNNTRPPRRVNQQVSDGQIILPSSINEYQIADLLRPYKQAKLLHLAQPSQLFGGFRDEAHRSQYELWLDAVTATWCCRTPAEALRHGAMRFVKLKARTRQPPPLRPPRRRAAAALRRRRGLAAAAGAG